MTFSFSTAFSKAVNRQAFDSALFSFAAKRSARLDEFTAEIWSIVERQLEDYRIDDKWYDDLVEAAAVLWLEIFEDTHPDGVPGGALDTFMRELGESLAKTSEPADPVAESQVDRVSNWIAVYTVNSATYHGGRSKGGTEKTWLSMDDASVREIHRAVDGQTVPILGTFDVGGSKLHFPGEPVGPPEVWINCRCLLAITGGTEMSGKTSFAADTEVKEPIVEDEERELTDEELDENDLVDDEFETPWHGVLVVEGVETGDKRLFDNGSITYGNLPLPISFQRMSADGHLQSIVVGRIDEIWLEGNEHRARGAFNLNVPEANEAIDGIVFGMLGGVSVDVDSAEFTIDFKEEQDEDDLMGMLFGDPGVTRFTSGRLRGATLVSIPAFQEAFIALGPDFEEEIRDPEAGVSDAAPGEDDADTEIEEEEDALVAAAFAPGTHDGPGWITHPRSTQRLRSYWVHGAGAKKIRWGVPGDFNRCRAQLGKYVNPAFLAGTCANLHKEALKVWPGQETGQQKHGRDEESAAPAFSLVASLAMFSEVPGNWFDDPQLTEPTPITVTEEGRIYGHIAAFGTCHLGIGERCVMPPHSTTDYSYFAMGVVETDDGPRRTGPVVMWTGHAGSKMSASKATAHYDNTGHAIADISVGEDNWGIWFAGKIRDDASPEDIKVLKASTLSGDWRDAKRTGYPDEMVGVLAVNVPGFPIPRPAFAMDGASQLSLTASAGLLAPRTEKSLTASNFITPDELDEKLSAVGRIVADELEFRAARKERLSTVRDPELMELASERRAERLRAARELES